MKKLPPFSADLIAELDRLYPHRHPTPDLPDREIWMRAGERRVVDFLLAKLREAQENILENT